MRSEQLGGRSNFVVPVGLFLACLVMAWATELLSRATGNGVSIWMVNGMVMAVAIVSPITRWPALAVAGAAAEALGNMLWYGHQIGPLMLFIFGNLATAFGGALMLRRIITGHFILSNIRDVAAFLAVVLVVMPLISATTGSFAVGWSDGRAPLAAWERLFLGDATGTVIAAPAVLMALGRAAQWPRLVRWRQAEAAVLMLVFAGLAAVSLSSISPFVFVMVSPILWASLRFRVPGAVIANAALTIFALMLTAVDVSPFGAAALYGPQGLRGLQLFLIVAASMALLIGAMAEENRDALRRLNASNRDLADRDAEKSVALVRAQAREANTSRLIAAIGEACPDLIFAKDRDGEIVYANSATATVLDSGSDPADDPAAASLLQARASELDFISRNDSEVIRTAATLIVEEPFTLASGEQRIYRVTKAPLFDADGAVAGLAGVGVDVTDSKKAAAREELLIREIEHRGRNLLAIVNSIVQLTNAGSVDTFRSAISGRLRALARTHDVIARTATSASATTDFSVILRDEFAPYLEPGDARLTMTGGELTLDAAMAQSLALVVHELVTNAAKYGALSNSVGRLDIRWSVERGDGAVPVLKLAWRESGGPPVSKPTRTGFGSTVINFLVQQSPGGAVCHRWEADGLGVEFTLPLPSQADARA